MKTISEIELNFSNEPLALLFEAFSDEYKYKIEAKHSELKIKYPSEHPNVPDRLAFKKWQEDGKKINDELMQYTKSLAVFKPETLEYIIP